MSFNNKVVLITGASSGIGAAIALQFALQGAKVVITGRNENKLRAVCQKCEQCDNKPLVIIGDVTKDEDIKRFVGDTVKQFNRLDVLVNNIGIAGTTSILSENAVQVFDQMISTNLRSAVYITHLAAPHLIETKGNIVNIGSIGGSAVLMPGNFSYCVSKAGLEHFTRCVALELIQKGVRVNIINPGPVKTDCMDNIGVDEENQNKFWATAIKGTALGKITYPEEIADLTLYLASDKARIISGTSFVVDNGVSLKGLLEL